MRTILKFSIFCLNKAKILVIIAVFALNAPIPEVAAAWSFRDVVTFLNKSADDNHGFLVIGRDSILSVNMPAAPQTMRVTLTAYSSTSDQTDSTPFVTASNTRVRDGIVAANFLAFGTRVKIPSLFGDKVFTVEDRMAKKHNDKVDIWFSERYLAKNFGVKEADVIILE